TAAPAPSSTCTTPTPTRSSGSRTTSRASPRSCPRRTSSRSCASSARPRPPSGSCTAGTPAHVAGVHTELPKEDQLQILRKLSEAEAFERFLHNKYTGHKRFSLEGGESLIPMLDAILDAAADDGMESTVIGMSHRGRLNALANTVGKSYGEIFGEFEGNLDPTLTQGSGDVKYHLGAVGKHVARSGKEVGG